MAPAGSVALIAGGGGFPAEVAGEALAAGRQVTIVGLRGFAARRIAGLPVDMVDILDPAALLARLKRFAPACVVLAGSVTRPGPLAIASVFSAFRNREEIGRVLSGGDDRILRGAVALIEDAGFTVVGAHEIAPRLLAPAGLLARREVGARAAADIATAARLLHAIGPYDVGQGCVIAGGRVLAVEGPEGTDAMLERVASLQRRGKQRLDTWQGVLVKLPKPGQDVRVDLPAIGPRTITRAAAAGLGGIAIGAGGVVVIERAATIAAADAAGMFVTGIVADTGP